MKLVTSPANATRTWLTFHTNTTLTQEYIVPNNHRKKETSSLLINTTDQKIETRTHCLLLQYNASLLSI
uniref:Uncharacterized protein n=1 Tax=Arion vulgaris TaxID=1028688 RepID=A0A0B7BAK9_9EUPU